MIKKIFAIVTEKDYYGFQQQSYKDGPKMGDTFANLIHAYANGYITIIKEYKQKRIIDMSKKIFTVVVEKDFHNFREKAYNEDLKMGEALSALAYAYATGKVKLNKNHRSKHKEHVSESADYIKDHKDG